MIFVTVGTYQGDRLVREIDRIAPMYDEPMVAQIGRGEYIPRNCAFFRFSPSLEPYFREARVLVSHGGVGTTFELLNIGVSFVAVSSADVPDAHQEELLSRQEDGNLLIWCRDISQLSDGIRAAAKLPARVYLKPRCRIAELVANLLDI